MFPDPATRYQPFGPHGASEVVDAGEFRWNKNEAKWSGVALKGQVIYELHIGTFTEEGTFAFCDPKAATPERSGDDCRRGDAGRGFSGAVRLGL